jgi:threonine synthase
MKFYSTNDQNHFVSLEEAVIKGLAPDQGLYMPENIPRLPVSFFENISQLSFRGNRV